MLPNPATDKLTVTLTGTSNEIEFIITDALGKKLNSYSIKKSAEINLTNLSNGIYFYTVYSQNKNIGTGKFVKN